MSNEPEEPSVIGGGCGMSPMPSREVAEKVWRQLYADRIVTYGLDRESAEQVANAAEVDLSENPADCADDEVACWDNDGDGPDD